MGGVTQAVHQFDIVIPVLNEAWANPANLAFTQWLAALAPVRARGARVIVVDGGSDDDTAAAARPYADHVVAAPRGRACQMNAGAQCGSAGIILFLHADTTLPDDALAAITRAVQVGGIWGRFDVRIDSPRLALRCVSAMMNWRSRWTGIATGDQAIFVTRNAFASVGGFPEIALMEDIALSKNLKQIAAPACLRQTVVTSARRWQQQGVWRTIWLMWRLRAAYFFGADPTDLAVRYGYRPGPKP